MDKKFIKTYLEEYPEVSKPFKKNLIKEYLQIFALSFIYSKKKYRDLIFYGGSCLKYCFGLERLSEDLDFVDLKKKINLEDLKNELVVFFEKEFNLKIKAKIQKFRIYFKFPILKKLELAEKGESDFLYLKIEIFKKFNFCSSFKIKIIPVFKIGKSILIRTFDLPTLMATKIRAILYRKWEKTDKKGKVFIKAKGRDYYDLMWYLEKKIKPNLKCIEKIKTKKILKEKLLEIVKKIDQKSIRLDLESLIKDQNFIKDLSKNLKEILIEKIKEI
ncbi:MAG: nucleotidyl transferase AbiEii/AbiGii toxin family protein [Candidatus Kuenenbacteria bacterium]